MQTVCIKRCRNGNKVIPAGKGESMPILRSNSIYEETGSTACIERGQKTGVFVIVGYKKSCFDEMKGLHRN